MLNLSEMVENLVYESDDTLTYTEALSQLVEEYQIDYGEVKKMLSLGLYQKICQEYNLSDSDFGIDVSDSI